MMTPEERALFEGRNFASLATLMPDGSPQVSPVWIELDGDDIVVNSAEGRTKTDNVRRDSRVAVSIFDQDDPYVTVMVRGVVTSIEHEGAEEGIDRLAKKYLGEDRYPWPDPDHPRVILRIRPIHVAQM
jgi:PPOX class probable F420-dependent enzyme